MRDNLAVVVTSIAAPNAVLRALADGCRARGHRFIVVGDEASPADFRLEGCDFYGLAEQAATGFEFAALCPTRHYARKNLGYLLAVRGGARVVVETDDDNVPRAGFWGERRRRQSVPALPGGGWVNVYGYFTDAHIWPRGLPLDRVREAPPAFERLEVADADCPVQQGLADENPDVDAVYRLVATLPQSFRADRRVALGRGSWCPFNSQNTSWWAEAFPLLYLPAYCSFRMTDIWRSFVAQRVAWEQGWAVLFHEPTVWQERNEHNLMRDFRDEVPGYLHNSSIAEALGRLELRPGVEHLGENVRACYEKLVEMRLVGAGELPLLDAWLRDLGRAVEGK
ncbi:MAG TPA: STELLO glycosyltransferase family protein [Pyrinomonadaceae bacterium]|nr:STELLO glycosyltransferase family protein [Pyrinomonadaceae bacterium]